MDTVDTIQNAYLLGCIATGGFLEKRIVISVDPSYQEVIDKLCSIGFYKLDANKVATSLITTSSSQLFHDILKHMTRETLPEFTDEKLRWAFLRGYIDMACCIKTKVLDNGVQVPQCSIIVNNVMMLHICEMFRIPYSSDQTALIFEGTNCMDMLGKLYKDSTPDTRLRSNYEKFVRLATLGVSSSFPVCQVFRTDDQAVLPKKEKMSDVGYDLTIIKESKKWHNDITLYDTGIRINIEHGYYAEVVPRSSLSKSGYMLANSIGIIDPSYRGNILVALVKVDKSAPDLELPFRCCQLIFKKQVNMDIAEVPHDFDTTTRADGGFGSTN